jgi:hypothetical protein
MIREETRKNAKGNQTDVLAVFLRDLLAFFADCILLWRVERAVINAAQRM